MGPKGVKPKRSAFRKIGHAVNVVRSALHEQRKRSSRSPKWRTVEKAQLVAHPTCAACGGTIRLNVHHIKPYHLFPELELEPTNLITLCMGPMECHLRLGHGGLFRAYVVDVVTLSQKAALSPADRAEIEKTAKDARQV